MRIAQEELFGPVMGVLKWDDERTMWKEANSVEYGFKGSIYTSNYHGSEGYQEDGGGLLLDQHQRDPFLRAPVWWV